MNKLELLKTFVRVSELSSFTQAADSLGLPRSTVSDQVQALEDLLGARLLQRTTRRVQATQDGLLFYERSRELLAQMDELEGLFREDATTLAGRIRVDMPTVLARKVVMPRLAEFTGRHPGVEIEVSSTDRRVDLVREGFDLVLRAGPLLDTSLVARSLGGFPLVNVASRDYLAVHGVPRTLEDLARHRLVHYVSVLGSRPPGFEYLVGDQVQCLPMAGSVTVNNAEAYSAACLGGLGLIQVPLHGVREYLQSGELVALLPDYQAPPLEATLLYAHRRLPRRVRAFMDWLEQVVREQAAPWPQGA
ncbi:LysR family transcriptional regulator [Metapseudomonas lalkuanensis]|jgi:DNA-binding transcriptional LysR family regulator|uniref:LysR family transcriptional regulator n=1 Tax=Metapseudomonas lalkuanensis TaxID=2604832 RepID=UPI001CF1363B|nr:LysR family transcriptional regulator [Pseudomonas lalkuanensis]UCO99757.1 LysR family transcriptional regulator [Pseudomonas lalkuanensis]